MGQFQCPASRKGASVSRVCTHFPKDQNCDICLMTKIARSSCRRRANAVVPRVEHFGDLITADDKVLSEENRGTIVDFPWWYKIWQHTVDPIIPVNLNKNGIRIPCNTENFVPIVGPGC